MNKIAFKNSASSSTIVLILLTNIILECMTIILCTVHKTYLNKINHYVYHNNENNM